MIRILDTSTKSILGCALALAVMVPLMGAKAATFEVLYTFQGGSDGGRSVSNLIEDKTGNLYGTTDNGGGVCGGYGCGTVFKLAPDGTETKLHAFGSGNDGAFPQGGLIADKAGNFYGTTGSGGGSAEDGTVFKLARNGTETVLYSFKGGSDGAVPVSGLILENGNLYGTTLYGGGTGCFQQTGCGTVFKVALNGNEAVLHAFYRHHSDGRYPYAGLVADSAGNLYGTTWQGGLACRRSAGCGTAFRLAPDGTESVLYAFHSMRGSNPFANLHMDSAGNLYGTTYLGGAHTAGTVFKLAPDGTETVLYSFCSQTNCGEGGEPYAGVIADKAGNLYGTAFAGGQVARECPGGCGTVFKLAPDGIYTVLYTFTGGSDGASPMAGLLLRKGYLYGTASAGGGGNCTGGCGTVFQVKL